MRNVRIIYSKQGRMKFVSHLDMNRYMSRLIKISGIPAWHTEGFNKHLYLTFALPLSLGMTADYDVIDMKITDDVFSDAQVQEALQRNATAGIEIISVGAPVMKVPELSFAEYSLTYKDSEQMLLEKLERYLNGKSIPAVKKGKKGKTAEINVADKIYNIKTTLSDGCLNVTVVLPAGNTENINPALFVQSFCDTGKRRPEVCLINRNMIFNESMEKFR